MFLCLRLGEAEAEAVETVPAHRRGRRPVMENGSGESRARDHGACERKSFEGCFHGKLQG